MKFIDLFCGIGGFHQALVDLGHECVIACDTDKKCRDVYYKNYGIVPHDNVKTLNPEEMEDFDILCAGFPCQPFSNGGQKRSFEDSRGLLFDEIIRIAAVKKPEFMFLENVKHIKKVSNGEVFSYILSKLDKTGYYVKTFIMSPHRNGIPQLRERVYFVCVRMDIYDKYKRPEIEIVQEQLKINILEKAPDEKYKIGPELMAVLEAWDELIKNFSIGEKISPTILIKDYYNRYTDEEYSKIPKWKRDYMVKNKILIEKYQNVFDEWYKKYNNVLSRRQIYSQLDWQVGPIKQNDSIFKYFIQVRQSGIRVKTNDSFPTLVAINQTPIYGTECRYITPRECCRLQCFPETFKMHESDNVSYKQFGNAVNVFNAKLVIKHTMKYFQC